MSGKKIQINLIKGTRLAYKFANLLRDHAIVFQTVSESNLDLIISITEDDFNFLALVKEDMYFVKLYNEDLNFQLSDHLINSSNLIIQI